MASHYLVFRPLASQTGYDMGDQSQKPTPEQIAEAIAENRRLLGEDVDNPFSTSGQFVDEPSLIEQMAREYREQRGPIPVRRGKGNGGWHSEDYIPVEPLEPLPIVDVSAGMAGHGRCANGSISAASSRSLR